MSTTLDAIGSALEGQGWVRYSGGDYHIPGLQHIAWTHRTLPLRLWSIADRTGVRSHVLACSLPKGAGWAWRVELAEADDRLAMVVISNAVSCVEENRPVDPGRVFTGLAQFGWEITCGTDVEEPSYGATADGASLVQLPDSPVDPGMWVITTPSGSQLTASSGTPWPLVLVMAALC